MTFSEQVKATVGVAIKDISIVEQPQMLDLSKLEKAVVIVHAMWSGTSVRVLREYSAAYHKLFVSDHSVSFFVLDIDRIQPGVFNQLMGPLGGNGETFLIRNGTVVGSIPNYTDTFQNQLSTVFN